MKCEQCKDEMPNGGHEWKFTARRMSGTEMHKRTVILCGECDEAIRKQIEKEKA